MLLPRIALAMAFLLVAVPTRAADALALLPLELESTSLEPTRPDEIARLALLNDALRARLAKAGYRIADLAPVAADIAAASSLRGCNGCEIDLGRKLGAKLVALGWVQKVSNLILNLNLLVRDVATGRILAAGSVDIRGNTDESWQRGADYLLDHRILPRLRT